MGKKILVADSDSVVLQVVSYFLKLEGFDVETVGDGISAMEAIEKSLPNVIIMTPVLPGLNGVEVSQFVRENPQYKAIPIIFLSESEEPLLNNIPDLFQKFGVVNKPIDPTKLVNTVKEYIEKEYIEKEEIEKESAPSDDVVESLKSIEELLGWDMPDKKLLYRTEEVLQEKSMEGSFDVAAMLAGINHVSAKETDFSPSPQANTQFKNETRECYPELVSVAFVEEIPKQVRDDIEPVRDVEPVRDTEPMCDIEYMDHIEHMASLEESEDRNDSADECFDFINESAVSETKEAEKYETEIKNRITDEMIENMVRKIAVDIVERVTKDLIPDIAEREITKEIERIKGIE